MKRVVRVPRDAAALSLGADETAAALVAGAQAAGHEIELVRTGSRGICWLEPLVEVETGAGSVAYGPVDAQDVPALLAAGMLDGGSHPLRRGPVAAIPWFASQQRVTFERVGAIDCPALVLWGERDPYIGLSDGRAFERQIGGARFVPVADAGHWPWIDRPELVDEVVEFLDGQTAAPGGARPRAG